MTLRSGFLPPFNCLGDILGSTVTAGIHHAEFELRIAVTLFGGLPKPFHRLGGISGNVVTVGRYHAEHK